MSQESLHSWGRHCCACAQFCNHIGPIHLCEKHRVQRNLGAVRKTDPEIRFNYGPLEVLKGQLADLQARYDALQAKVSEAVEYAESDHDLDSRQEVVAKFLAILSDISTEGEGT